MGKLRNIKMAAFSNQYIICTTDSTPIMTSDATYVASYQGTGATTWDIPATTARHVSWNNSQYIYGGTTDAWATSSIKLTGCEWYSCDSTAATSVMNITLAANSSGYTVYWPSQVPPLSKVDQFRQKIRENLAPHVYVKRNGQDVLLKDSDIWSIDLSQEEVKARGLLREMIGHDQFKRYLKRGFIMVGGRSGVMYKVHGGDASAPSRGLIESYVKNPYTGRYHPFEAFCVQFKDQGLPHTDGVVMRKMLIEHDEFGLRKIANVISINNNQQSGEIDKNGNIVLGNTRAVIMPSVAVG